MNNTAASNVGICLEGLAVGLLVAIEGIDGSGKGTQAARLRDSLQAAGFRTELFSFPRYRETRFGAKIGDFLNGRFGDLDQVSPFLASLLFAGDRFESRSLLEQAIAAHDVVLCDRYVASNIAHQAAKVLGAERQELIQWIQYVEHTLYGLPHPDCTLFLDLPVRHATRLIALKAQRSYTERAADLQEADAGYLQKVHDVYGQLASEEAGWIRIDCLNQDNVRSIDQIADDVLRGLGQVLPAVQSPQKRSVSDFEELVASRKAWIADVLQPWCRSASLLALKQAEVEWLDIAGKVAAEKTLWPWAWSRFPDLVHESLGIEETTEVAVTLSDGRVFRGYPDSRASQQGQLVLWGSETPDEDPRDLGPFSIERIVSIKRLSIEAESH